jgi:hypothetical protein
MPDKDIEIELDVSEKCKEVCWEHLPPDSQAIKFFGNSLYLFVRNLRDPEGKQWHVTMDHFRRVWPLVMQSLIELCEPAVLLVYFSGLLIDKGLLSVFPHLTSDGKDAARFYCPEFFRGTKSITPVMGHLCFEYHHRNFLSLVGESGFKFFPDTRIIGIFVDEPLVKKVIREDVFDKNILESLLAQVSCWWACDSDLEGITIWHKSLPSEKMLGVVKDRISKTFGYTIKILKQ